MHQTIGLSGLVTCTTGFRLDQMTCRFCCFRLLSVSGFKECYAQMFVTKYTVDSAFSQGFKSRSVETIQGCIKDYH
jgi:hypothetical protein